jgi:acyl-CoA reductase-like NAD-dependent aldehyde dehydrogenase
MAAIPKIAAATVKMLIGGQWREGEKTYEVRDPYRGEVVARAPESSLKDLDDALDAIRRLRVGGVIVNGTSTWRTDQLAYGGIKASGIGREGPKFAIRDMTDERLVVFNL